jgi:predicted MPP superfamily phosphohydrolase
MGLYRLGDTWLYTNRGLGTARPYVRLNCRPEITLFTLHAGAPAKHSAHRLLYPCAA